jgi:hypothetical protein
MEVEVSISREIRDCGASVREVDRRRFGETRVNRAYKVAPNLPAPELGENPSFQSPENAVSTIGPYLGLGAIYPRFWSRGS